MNFGTWFALLGHLDSEPAVVAALAAAGVKRVPKVRDGVSSIFELKRHALWLEFHRAGRRATPLVLMSVQATLTDGYDGELPFGLAANLNQAQVRTLLGAPSTIIDDVPADLWLRDGIEWNLTFTSDRKLATVAATLLRPEA